MGKSMIQVVHSGGQLLNARHQDDSRRVTCCSSPHGNHKRTTNGCYACELLLDTITGQIPSWPAHPQVVSMAFAPKLGAKQTPMLLTNPHAHKQMSTMNACQRTQMPRVSLKQTIPVFPST